MSPIQSRFPSHTMIRRAGYVLCAGLFALSCSASANEAGGEGGAKLDQLLPVCSACHGEHGAKPILPEYPVLAGQYANYLEHSLKDYRGGVRKNAVMKAQAANLSDADIKALSQYFAHQKSPIYVFKLPLNPAKP